MRRWQIGVTGLFACALIVCAVLGLRFPRGLLGAGAWSILVGASLWGLGALVRRSLGGDLRIGEQLAVGTALWIAAGGVLLAAGVASRGPLLVLAAAGLCAAVVDLHRRVESPAPVQDREHRAAWIAFWVLLSLYLALNLLAMVGMRGNPADDHAAYTALVKRLLDCGNLDEPFSFRRLSAYGGQTVLQALAAARGDVASIDLLDRGVFHWIAVLLVLDVAHRRKLSFVMTVAAVVVLVSVWSMELNSGAIWTSFTLFAAAYAFATRDDIAIRPRLVLVLAVLAAVCALRQNYLVPAGMFGLLQLLAYVRESARGAGWRAGWRAARGTVLLALAAAAVVILPYMIAAAHEIATPLYPLVLGTGNPNVPLRPRSASWIDELIFFIAVIFGPEPIKVWWLLLPAMLLARDPRPLKPWPALLAACACGFLFLVHAFMASDTWDLWRYAFAYLTALAVLFLIEVGSSLPLVGDGAPRGLRLPIAAGFLVWVAMAVNLIDTRPMTIARFQQSMAAFRGALVYGSNKIVPSLAAYGPLQQAIPAGAAVAVVVDDPWAMDFARQRLYCLDFPGFAGPGPGLPSFTDPEHWRSYFLSRGIRYLAFADPTEASYMYRRTSWTWRMYSDDELYQAISVRMVDALDTMMALTSSARVVFHQGGLWAIDLGEHAPPEADRGPPEIERMDAFVRRFSETVLHNNAWQLTRRRDLVFDLDGAAPSAVMPQPGSHERMPGAWEGLLGVLRGSDDVARRWLMERTRIRVWGDGPRHLHVKLWIKRSRAYTVPTMTVSLDGEELASASPDAMGFLAVDVDTACHGWCDLYLRFSNTFDWWTDPATNGLAALTELEWTERR